MNQDNDLVLRIAFHNMCTLSDLGVKTLSKKPITLGYSICVVLREPELKYLSN